MKIVKPFRVRLFTLATSLTLSSASLCQAAVIVDFGDSQGTGQGQGLVDTFPFRQSITFWQTGTESAGDLLFTDIAATDPATGTAFTFDLTVSAILGIDQVSANGGQINGSLGETVGMATAVTNFTDNDEITITVSNISVATVSFDGFVNFGTDSSGTGEGFNVNGIDYIRGTDTNGDTDPRQGVNLPTGGAVSAIATRGGAPSPLLVQNSVDISFIGDSVGLRGISLEFSDAIPEPSSTLLIGIGSLSLLARRKRK